MAKAAILGLGIVGTGVAEILDKNADRVCTATGEPLELKTIVEIRPCPDSPYAEKIVSDFALVEQDPEIEVVCECIGGVGVALDFVRRCLRAGKSVATPNKQMISEYGPELLALAKEHHCSLLFEASVGGGIPIIRPLLHCMADNRYEDIFGILNGTTNYILTSMIQEGTSFDTALRQAQQLGYAEADPTADVEGIDACRKIAILSDLCFGFHTPPSHIPTQGIKNVSLDDAVLADQLGYVIKLLGRAYRVDPAHDAPTPLSYTPPLDARVAVYVAPHLLRKDQLLANIQGVMNGIVVRGNAVGECLFYGAGAGRYPTASAVVSDMIECIQCRGTGKPISWGPEAPERLVPFDDLSLSWYVRVADKLCAALSERMPGEIANVDGHCAAISEPMTRPALFAKLEGLEVENIFPVL